MININSVCNLNCSHGKLNIVSLYVQRYLRMTPLLAVYLLMSVSLLRFVGNGPVFPISVDFFRCKSLCYLFKSRPILKISSLSIHLFFRDNCKRYWWATLLHIQNYVNPGQIVSVWWDSTCCNKFYSWTFNTNVFFDFVTIFYSVCRIHGTFPLTCSSLLSHRWLFLR